MTLSLPRLFPAPWQRLWSGLEPTSQVWIYEGLMAGVPRNTGTVLLAMDDMSSLQPRPAEWTGQTTCVPRFILYSMRTHLGTATGVVKIPLRKINILHNVFTRIICFVLHPSYCKMENYCLTAKKFILGCSCQFSTKYGAENPKLFLSIFKNIQHCRFYRLRRVSRKK